MPSLNAVAQPFINEAEEKMKKSVDKIRQEYASLRTGRATGSLLDHLKVEYYGSHVPLKQVAAVSVPEGRTLEVKPWDIGALAAIEKAIRTSDLGLNPTNDGKMLRLNIPTLTEERRKEMVKHVKKVAEDFRVSIRNDRRDAMEKIKKAEKDKTLSEDDRKNAEHALQHVTDLYIKKIDETHAIKEKDILEI